MRKLNSIFTRKVIYNNKIGRVCSENFKVATVVFNDGEVTTMRKDELQDVKDEFDMNEKVKVLVDGDFFEGFIVKKLDDSLFLVVMDGNLLATPSTLIEKIKGENYLLDNLGTDLSKDTKNWNYYGEEIK